MSPRTLGVEEEFHLVDLKTRRLTARGPELLAELSDHYVAELQRCVVETNTRVVDSLDGLRGELVDHRRVLVDTAAELGIGVVAAGAMPLSVPAEMQVTKTARYRQMLADYQLLAREQLICGTQVHVGVERRVILHGALGGDSRSIIQLGLLLLIATPIARVVFAVAGFLFEKDWLYVAVSLLVLAILLYSLVFGR